MMQRIKEAEYPQIRAQAPNKSSSGKTPTSSSDNSLFLESKDILNKDSRSLWFNDSPMTLRQQNDEDISLF